MYMTSVLKHLIYQEACFPALKLVWDDQVDAEDFGELPKLTPSHYFNENRLTTEERHALLCRQQRKMSYRKPGAEVVIEPPIIVFQNYQFGETYSFPIVVRNISKNSQKVALLMDESYAFKFDECSQRVAKFPCGMCITATITFTPENETEDCYHRLVVSTNATKVAVPIIAIGSRPLLNTPDSLVLSDAPVRHWTVKPVTILNTGKKVANLTLSTTGVFCVAPEKALIPPNQAFTFEVSYFSGSVGSHEGEVCFKHDNGEEVYMYLKGNAVNCNISLSNPDVRCDDTFISLQTRSSFFIDNNSGINAKFYWRMNRLPVNKQLNFVSDKADNPEKQECNDPLQDLISGELKEEFVETEQENLDIYQCDKPSEPQNGPDPLFSNDNFHVYPLFGEVKPNSKAEIHIVFSPTECAFYEGVAYLDINGLDKRLPFTFFGRGLGPKFRLAFETLNVGDVALGGAHTYEVPVQNVSEIPGSIQCDGLVGAPSGMGLKIEPLMLGISPGQYAAFYVNFTCTGKPGPFEDEIKFSIPQTGDVFYVTVKGKITYPCIRFANPETQLGNLSYGFAKSYYIPLVNDSLNFVDVELKMESDGIDAPVDFNTILKSFKHEHFRFDKQPAEFRINPGKFTLRPKGLQKVQLTMYPNQVREVRNKLNCWITDEEGNDVETVASTNIRGSVIVPPLQAIKESVHLKDCYLQFPYTAEFIIKNASELPVIYCLVQKPSSHLKIESNNFVGIAEPWVETPIPFEVVCIASGEAVAHFDLYAVGNDTKMMSLTVRCDSIPSKVEASNKNADFGKIEVMEEKILTVDIVNTSPLNFPFTSSIFLDEPSDKGEIWKVEPESGLLAAQSRVTFMVSLLLKEVGYHYAGIRVSMTEPLKHVIEVRIKALGVGSPLVFNPPLERFATVAFGTIFIKQEKTFEYEITNRGVNPRVLEWKPIGERGPLNRPWETKALKKQAAAKKDSYPPPPPPPRKSMAQPKDKETHKKEPLRKPPLRAPFVINPMKIVLPPGGTAKMTVSSYSATPKILEETWNIWSFVPATKGLQVEDESGEGTPPPSTKSKSVKKQRKSGENDKKRKIPATEPQNLHLRPVIINEVRLFAIFEAPGLRFSKRVINFIIEATPTHENYVVEESLKIENVGTLPLKVKLRTKFPFSFCQRHEDMPTEEGTYQFDTQKSLSFKVQFDGRHLRKELGVVMFEGKLEAHYEGLQGAESVELHGEVRFPQVNMDKTFIDFGTITNGMEAVEQINVTNTGAFCLTYKWYLKPGATHIHKNPEPAWAKDLYFDSYKPSMKHRLFKYKHRNSTVPTDSATGTLIPISTLMPQKKPKALLYEVASGDHIAEALGLSSGAIENAESNYEDFTQFLEEKMYRSRMMEFMGLKDAEFEAEDEVNYLAFYNQNSTVPKEEFNTNEIIDIIPLAGVIESGKSQSFTVVFYGYPDIDFKTSLVLYIEGGARKTVEIKGTTVPPTKLPLMDS